MRGPVTIPDDWPGDAWACYQLRWPDSPQYRRLLYSLLYELTRGRSWNEATGSVVDAQAVGWEIFDGNWPLMDCEGVPDTPSNEVIRYIAAGCAAWEEEDEMPCIDLTNLIKIEGGKLYVRDACCEWHEVGAIETSAQLPADLSDDSLPAGVTDWACRKAYALGQFWEDVGTVVSTNASSDPFTFAEAMRTQTPYTDWSSGDLVNIWAEVFTFNEVLPGYDPQWTSEDTELLICSVLPQMSDTSQLVTDDEFKAALNVAKSIKGFVAGGLWYDIFRSAERNRLNRVVQMGLWNSEADCSCPETLALPGTYDWMYDYDFSDGENGFTLLNPTDAAYSAADGGYIMNSARYSHLPKLEKASEYGDATTYLKLVRVYITWAGYPADGGAGASPHWTDVSNGDYTWDAAQQGSQYIQVSYNVAFAAGRTIHAISQFQCTNAIDAPYPRPVITRIILAGDGTWPWTVPA